MTPKTQAKIKPQFPQHANEYTILSFNHIMRIYSNVYNYAI